MKSTPTLLALTVFWFASSVESFQSRKFAKPLHSILSIGHQTSFPVGRKHAHGIALNSSNGDNSFDISKATFDLYTLRSIRGDALLRYNSLNQSEPLRINLYLIAMVSFFSYPVISQAVFDEPATLPGTIGSLLAGSFSTYRFIRECGRRSRKLNRMERELNSESLSVRILNNQLADRAFGSTPYTLRQLRGSRRVLTICGTKEELKKALVPFRTLGRRLVQASVLVVPVPTDGSSSFDEWGVSTEELRSSPYFAEVVNPSEWSEYFRSLIAINNEDLVVDDELPLAWFGFANSGKSFGSGIGPPRLVEVLGQNLLPVEILDPTDKPAFALDDDEERAIFDAQQKFYEALTGGSLPGIQAVFQNRESPQVQEVVEQGGSIDGWEKCLEEGARPSGMKVSGTDVLIVSDTEAYSTIIEFPMGDEDVSATLLAVQQWSRESKGKDWKLQLHQTIPWGPDSRAGATLRCDCRGCTALTSEPVRKWNFRGMID